MKFRAKLIIWLKAREYLKEFKKAQLAEVDEGFYIYVGDKHYFEFQLQKHKLVLIRIFDIIYAD